MGSANDYLDALRSFLGTTEQPNGSNRTWLGSEYGWNGVAWCAIACSCAAWRANFDWFHTAWVPTIESWAKNGYNGMWWAGADQRPIGGMAIWDWDGDGQADHVSSLEAARSDGGVVTLGGNEVVHGVHGFWRQVRGPGQVNAYLRGFAVLPFADVPATPQPEPEPEQPAGNPYLPLVVDGELGPNTYGALQWRLNEVGATDMNGNPLDVDGEFGPGTASALQRYLGDLDIDGEFGPLSTKRLQAHLGVRRDGSWGPKTTAALQRMLNAGSF